MPSPQISQNKSGTRAGAGFLILEALIAMGILLMIIPAAVSLGFDGQALQISAQKKLDGLAGATDMIENGAYDQAAGSSGRYFHEFGKSTCTIGTTSPADFSKTQVYVNNPAGGGSAGINFGPNASGTDVTARNGYIYETVDSPTQAAADFYIIDARTVPNIASSSPVLVSSLNTGPGLAGVVVAGHYAYVANESSLSQLQVLDIADRTKPLIVAKFKLPLPTATTTAPHASSVSYGNGLIFLGTQKWPGNEFNVINVTQPASPVYGGGFDADTVVQDTYVDTYAVATADYAYVADADIDQMRVLDVAYPSHITLASGFSPAGYGVLEGMTFAASGESGGADTMLYFGRAGGGFDNPGQYELFSFDLSRDPLAAGPVRTLNVPGGVYGIVVCPGYIFLAVGDSDGGNGGNNDNGGSIQIWKDDFSSMLYSVPLPAKPVSLMCDHDRLYVGLAGPQGFAVVIPG